MRSKRCAVQNKGITVKDSYSVLFYHKVRSDRSFIFCFKCIEVSRASGYPTSLGTFETEMAARYFERAVAQPRPQGVFPWLWR